MKKFTIVIILLLSLLLTNINMISATAPEMQEF